MVDASKVGSAGFGWNLAIVKSPAHRCFCWQIRGSRARGYAHIVWGDDGKEQYLFDRNFPGTSEDKDGTDEVFVRARFVDGDCVSRVQNTNVVKGNF